MPAIVSVEDLKKTHGQGGQKAGSPALRGVSLEIRPGTFAALMGPSGSGKSTLLNIVGGLDSADSGRALFRGRDLSTLSDRALSDLRLREIGFVFQFFHLLPNLSARQNVEIPLRLLALPGKEVRDRAQGALERVGLGGKGERKPHELSGGEMQRVAIARAIVHRPALVLADEPTGNLDTKTGAEALELMRELVEKDGLTILMATHDSRGRDLCDQVVDIQDGLIVGEGGAARETPEAAPAPAKKASAPAKQAPRERKRSKSKKAARRK